MSIPNKMFRQVSFFKCFSLRCDPWWVHATPCRWACFLTLDLSPKHHLWEDVIIILTAHYIRRWETWAALWNYISQQLQGSLSAVRASVLYCTGHQHHLRYLSQLRVLMVERLSRAHESGSLLCNLWMLWLYSKWAHCSRNIAMRDETLFFGLQKRSRHVILHFQDHSAADVWGDWEGEVNTRKKSNFFLCVYVRCKAYWAVSPSSAETEYFCCWEKMSLLSHQDLNV